MLWLVYASVAVAIGLALFVAWQLFRRGMTDERIADAPYLLLACFTVLPSLAVWLRAMVADGSGLSAPPATLVYGAGLYALGAAIWAMGHMFARLRGAQG